MVCRLEGLCGIKEREKKGDSERLLSYEKEEEREGKERLDPTLGQVRNHILVYASIAIRHHTLLEYNAWGHHAK